MSFNGEFSFFQFKQRYYHIQYVWYHQEQISNNLKNKNGSSDSEYISKCHLNVKIIDLRATTTQSGIDFRSFKWFMYFKHLYVQFN